MSEEQPSGFDAGDEQIDLTQPQELTQSKPKKSLKALGSVLLKLKWAAYLTEFLGTFYLTLVVALTATSPQQPLAIGACLTSICFMGGHISGGHFNPAGISTHSL